MGNYIFMIRLGFGLAAIIFVAGVWFSRERLKAGAVRSITGGLAGTLGVLLLLAVLGALPGGDPSAGLLGREIGAPLARSGGILAGILPVAIVCLGVAHFLDFRVRPHVHVTGFSLLAFSGFVMALAVATDGTLLWFYGGLGAAIGRLLESGLGTAGAYLVALAWATMNLLLAFPLDLGGGVRRAVQVGVLGTQNMSRATARSSGRATSHAAGFWSAIRERIPPLWSYPEKEEGDGALASARAPGKAPGSGSEELGGGSRQPVAERQVPGIPASNELRPRQLEITGMIESPEAAVVPRRVTVGHNDVSEYRLPPATLLEEPNPDEVYKPSRDELIANADALERKLADFGIRGEVREVSPGPVITRYEVVPAPGVKINRIAALADDLAMSLKALRVRILAPIPGKDAVGVEVPNQRGSVVRLREILSSKSFADPNLALPVALGKAIDGESFSFDLTRAPHLLIAGATGAGKSVCINSIIASFLAQASPKDLRLLLVDPKMLELSVYNGIPHLIAPVVTAPKDVARALHWAVAEMERRYKALSMIGVRSIAAYNRRVVEMKEAEEDILPEEAGVFEADLAEGESLESLPYIVVVIDELADLMLTVANEIEEPIARLAQMARAVGIHLILATQRPSVNVITGVIKANFPSRIAFQVASKTDSRTILDANGAEKLLGRGDMLYMAAGAAEVVRVHGAFLSDSEVKRLVDFIVAQGVQADRIDFRETSEDPCQLEFDRDELYDEALKLVVLHQQGSASLLQRRLKVGYARASRLIDELEAGGVVGQFEGSKSREVLVDRGYLEQLGLVSSEDAGTEGARV